MRDVPTEVTTALSLGVSHKQTARLTIYKSRFYFNEDGLETGSQAYYARPLADTDFPLPEAFRHTNYGFVSVAIDAEGFLMITHIERDPVKVYVADDSDYALTDGRSRPTMSRNGTVIYRNAAGEWVKLDVDLSISAGGTEDCVTSRTILTCITEPGAIHAHPATFENDLFMYFSISDGGVQVQIISVGDDLVVSTSPSRFMNPIKLLSSDEDEDVFSMHYSAVGMIGNDLFAYYTDWDGAVKCLKYSEGMWSDIFTSIPSDLSVFKIGNAISVNNAIFLCGAFERKEEFEADIAYTLLCKSVDGIVFSLDRRTLVSTVQRRFLVGHDGGEFLDFWHAGIFFEDAAHYQIVGEDTQKIVTELKSVNGGSSGSFAVSLPAASEQYFDHPFVTEGSFSKLELGVFTGYEGPGLRWIKYHDVVIASSTRAIQDGARGHNLILIPDAPWHTSNMSHPFYMEKAGKDGKYDPTLEFSNLYKLTGDAGVTWSFQCDLWPAPETGQSIGPQSHEAGIESDHTSADLTAFCERYPVFGDEASYEVNIYGWSRAGKPDTNPNTADPTDTAGLNDKVYAFLIVESPEGIETTMTAIDSDLVSDYNNFPQTYFEDGIRDGSYPIVYQFANPGEGYKLKKVGMRFVAQDVVTVYYAERVEIPFLKAQYKVDSEAPTFQIVEADGAWKLVDTISLQVTDDNATDGDQVTSAYTPRDGYCYAAVIIGDVEFDRDTDRFLQDAEFYNSELLADSPYVPPTWTRAYPPGVGPVANPAVQISASEFPYFGSGGKEYDGVTTVTKPATTHGYVFRHSDTRFENSSISKNKIPYFYSNGDAIRVALFLAGSGAISNIARGNFTVYLFESPEPFSEFDLYGGLTSGGGSFDFSYHNGDTISDAGTDITTTRSDYRPTGSYNEHSFFSLGHSLNVVNHSVTESVNLLVTFGMIKHTFVNDPPFDTGIYLNPSNPALPYPPYIWPKIEDVEMTIPITLAPGDGIGTQFDPFVNPKPGFATHAYDLEMWTIIEVVPTAPDNPQVPVPSSFILNIPATGDSFGDDGINNSMETRQKGIPQLLLATHPYNAFNYEGIARFEIQGDYSYAGVAALAFDEANFLVGYMRLGFIGLGYVREGVLTTIIESAVDGDPLETNKIYDLRFWHRDGLMGVEVKKPNEFWPQRGSQILHRWGSGDDPVSMAVDADVFHIGIYAYINPPKFRTTGFRSSQTNIPVMPLDQNPETEMSEFYSLFPDSGRVDIQGVVYTYDSKNISMVNAGHPYQGPFQLRNLESWDNPFNSDRYGQTYQGGKAIEITQFYWFEGTSHWDDLAGSIIGSSAGYAWTIDQTQYRVWITTGGEVVWLRNRARHYSATQPDYYGEGTEKIYITDGLMGVVPVTVGDSEYQHPWGSFAYIDNHDKVSVRGFQAFNGNHDQSIASLLDFFTKVAGTGASFIGDALNPLEAITDGGSVEI